MRTEILETLTATQRRIVEYMEKRGKIRDDDVIKLCRHNKEYLMRSNVANVHIKDLRVRLGPTFPIVRIRGDHMTPGYWKFA